MEDISGTRKTMLAKVVSISLNAKFKRIQFIFCLLPADIIGITIFDRAKYGNDDIIDKEFREVQTVALIFVELFSPIRNLILYLGSYALFYTV